MRISDWSSDVCSSDLQTAFAPHKPHPEPLGGPGRPECALADQSSRGNAVGRVHGRAGAERIGFLGAGAVEHALSPDPVEKAADRKLQLAASVAVVGFEAQPLGFFDDCPDGEVYDPADGDLPGGDVPSPL